MNNPQGEREHQQQKRKRRKKPRYLLKLGIIIAVIAVIGAIMHVPGFDVKIVKVVGNAEVTTEEIIRLSRVEKGKSVFDVIPPIAQYRIRKNLYIEEVNVNLKPPDTIEIIVAEKPARAQLVMGKNYVVIDNEGKVIEISRTEKPATLIENVDIIEADRKKKVKVRQEKRLAKGLELVRITEDSDMYFKRLAIRENKVEAHIYDSLSCRGEYGNLVSCLESGVLKSVVYDLYQKGEEKGTITVSDHDYCFFTPKK